MALSVGFRIPVSQLRSCYPSYGAPTLTPVGLSPTERASLRWTHVGSRAGAHGRVRWQFHGFRRGPQSGSPGHVSSPRHVERSGRISRTPLSCPLHAKAYETYRCEQAFRRLRGLLHRSRRLTHRPAGSAFPLAYIPRLRSCRLMGAFIRAPLPPVLPEELRTAGPLRSTGVTPLRRYCGPIRHPLVVSRFPGVAGYTAYPASADFAAGRGGLLQLLAVPLSPCCR